jgi:hypothetical protein
VAKVSFLTFREARRKDPLGFGHRGLEVDASLFGE